jgi:hypothetical protein
MLLFYFTFTGAEMFCTKCMFLFNRRSSVDKYFCSSDALQRDSLVLEFQRYLVRNCPAVWTGKISLKATYCFIHVSRSALAYIADKKQNSFLHEWSVVRCISRAFESACHPYSVTDSDLA